MANYFSKDDSGYIHLDFRSFGNQTINLNGDIFKYSYHFNAYDSEDIHSSGEIILRLEYFGSGIASHRFIDIAIPAKEFGFPGRPQIHFGRISNYVVVTKTEEGSKLELVFNNEPIIDPIMPIEDDNWAERSVVVYDTVSPNDEWIPAANTHTFSLHDSGFYIYREENDKPVFKTDKQKLCSALIVPEWAERKNADGKTDKIDKPDFSSTKKMPKIQTLAMAWNFMNRLSTPIEGLKQNIVWIDKTSFIDPNNSNWKTVAGLVKSASANPYLTAMTQDTAGVIAQTASTAYDSLSQLFQSYIFLPEPETKALNSNLNTVRLTFIEAIIESAVDEKKAAATLQLALKQEQFIKTKIRAFSFQSGGSEEKRLSSAANIFRKIQFNSGRSSANRILDYTLDPELSKQGSAISKNRNSFFGIKSEVTPEALPDSFLTATQLTTMINIVMVHFTLEQANKLYKPEESHIIDLSEKHSKYSKYLLQLEAILSKLKLAIDSPEFTTNFALNQALEECLPIFEDMGDVQEYLNGLFKDIDSTRFWENVIVETIKIVLVYLVVEVLTLGLASEFVFPALVRSGLSIYRAYRVTNAFRFISTAVLFSAGQYLMDDDPNKSFLRNLRDNLIMFGALKLTGKLYSNALLKAGKVGKFKAWFGGQVVALGHYSSIQNYII